MKAAFITGLREMVIRDVRDPQLIGAREVLVRVSAVGVCGSDMHYYTTGRIGAAVVEYPFILGHECSGVLQKVGSEVRNLKAGQRVAIDPLISCGQCDQCKAGRMNTCRNQRFLGQPGQSDGALAECLVLPEKCCYPVPAHVTAEQAAMVEPLSIAVHAQRMAHLDPGGRIAILGAGPIGLSVLLACRASADCKDYVTDLIPERLKLARQLGAAWTGDSSQEDVVANIRGAEPLGVDCVFECAGKQETIDQGVALLKPGGTLLLVGIPETDQINFPIHDLRRNEITIKNVRRQNECISPALNMIASGAINVDPLVTHHFSLDQAKVAFDLVSSYRDGVVKAIIQVSSSEFS